MNDNPQAFPSFERLEMLRSSKLGPEVKETLWVDGRGMSLRDYFAAKALVGSLAGTECLMADTKDALAGWCYDMADAMLEARKK